VNYYFRHKQNLYVEAFRCAFQLSIEAHPPDGGVPSQAPAEERLRGRVLSLMHRVLDPDNLEFDIVHKEMANPTGLLDDVMRECIGPIRRGFADVVRELLGPRAPEAQVFLCQSSVEAQCLHHTVPARGSGRSHTRKPHPGGVANASVEALAGHVTRFSLAGIREVRRRVESGGLDNTE
jgi:AcrR family transcriptional regulator